MQRTVVGLMLMLCFMFISISVPSSVQAADSDPMGTVIGDNTRLSTFRELASIAGLDGFFAGQGNYTVLAPDNDAFSSMNGGDLAKLKNNPNDARQFVLYHVLHGRMGSSELRGKGEAVTVLGPKILIEPYALIRINGTAQLTATDIESSNAVIHIMDGVLDPTALPQPAPPPPAPADNGSGGGESSAPVAPGEPTPVPTATKPPWWVEPESQSSAVIGDPGSNPAFVGGGYIPYWSGVMANSATCKGMTWVVHRQMNGVTEVGADRKTNPYRGDAGCNQAHSLLCMERNMSGPPSGDYSENWAYGKVQATVPIPGTRMQTKEMADSICRNTFGHTYRIAEFHDGNLGRAVGEASGWKFWAYGGLEPGRRYWVSISDQPANTWNSYQPREAISLNTWVEQILWRGGDSAFIGGGHMMPQEGKRAVRDTCMGMTWVIHRQFNGLVEVGADRVSNPYKGDRNCNQRFPVLCIKVQGYTPPPNANGADFSHGWSAGVVNTTYPMSGNEINTREKANNACRASFGGGWRMAEFHDGALGQEGTDGWTFWAYGGLNGGRRFWVAINDQPANPWNPTD